MTKRPAPHPLDVPDGMQCLATIDPSELAEALGAGATVVDVRAAEERADGFIAGSVHVPFDHFERDTLHESVREVLDAAAARSARIIVHCMYSRERAPMCARIAAAWRPALPIAVLRGGFQAAMAQLWDDAAPPALLSSVRRERWVAGPSRQGLTWAPDVDPLLFALPALAPVPRVNMDGLEGSSVPGGCHAARYGGGDEYRQVEPLVSLRSGRPPHACVCWPAVETAVRQTTEASLLRPPGYAEAMLRPPDATIAWEASTHLLITRVPPPSGGSSHASLMLHGWLFDRFGATPSRKAAQKFPLLAVVGATNLAPLDAAAGREPPAWLPTDGSVCGWADQHVHRDEPLDLGGFCFAEVFYGSDMARVACRDPSRVATLWLAAVDQSAADRGGAGDAEAAASARGLLTLVVLLPPDAPPAVEAALSGARPTAAGLATALSCTLPPSDEATAAARAVASLGECGALDGTASATE